MSKIDTIMEKLEYYPIGKKTRLDPSEDDLAKLEKAIGGKLPSDYRAFLEKYGSTGLGRGALFSFAEKSPFSKKGSLDQFYGFSSRLSDDILTLKTETYAGRIPDEMLPIGCDAGGNLILLSYKGATTNQVWFWDHEYRELAGKLDQIRADVKKKGLDTSPYDDHELIQHWQRLYPDKQTKPAGYANVYALADTFMQFLEGLQPDPAYNG